MKNMMDLSRRSWLKGVGLMSSLVAIGGITPIHQLSAEEIRKFRPRPLTGKIKLSSNGNPLRTLRKSTTSNDFKF